MRLKRGILCTVKLQFSKILKSVIKINLMHDV